MNVQSGGQTDEAIEITTRSPEETKSLGEITNRLTVIDTAQKNITELSGQVVSLQHVLDDNPARGAFGEVQLADLVESMLKRDVKIKDSSGAIPGHGGVLDRFDSLLFTAPVIYYYLKYFILE